MFLFRWVQGLVSYSVAVRGQSMEPTCPPGRLFKASRLAYFLRHPSRGDLVVVRPPGTPARLEIKRPGAIRLHGNDARTVAEIPHPHDPSRADTRRNRHQI